MIRASQKLSILRPLHNNFINFCNHADFGKTSHVDSISLKDIILPIVNARLLCENFIIKIFGIYVKYHKLNKGKIIVLDNLLIQYFGQYIPVETNLPKFSFLVAILTEPTIKTFENFEIPLWDDIDGIAGKYLEFKTFMENYRN